MTTRARVALASISAAVAVAAGCAPTGSEVRRSRDVAYRTEFATVWNAVHEAIAERYPRLAVDDVARGHIETGWVLTEKTTDNGGFLRMQEPRLGGHFFRVVIDVLGGPPWRVKIDGEAAEYKPDTSLLRPFEHGERGEPEWVRGKIDGLYWDVYLRLEDYAASSPGTGEK